MENIFLSILNMSLIGAFVIAAIILARLPLKKAPKGISYSLWAIAGFRLVFPFTLESVFSLLPFKAAPIPQDIAMQAVPRIDSGISIIDNAVSSSLPAATPSASMNPLQIWLFIGTCLWLLGFAVTLIYSVVSIVLLKRELRGAVHIEGNIYEAGNLKTPFVIGLFRARIYIPAGLSDEERRYIILHEQTHILRHDHIVKMLAYFILCLHWFNPFAWVAFVLMGADMEMSCDERVMKKLGADIKNAYSLSLVRVAAGRRILNGSPLAFGEGGMKERIKNVLNFKKSSRVIIIAAVALVAVLSVGFALSRASDNSIDDSAAQISTDDSTDLDMNKNIDNLNALSEMRTPYVGDNSAVGKIIDALPSLDENHMQRFFSIGDDYGTGRAPYTLTVYYEPKDAKASDERNMTVTPKNSALLFALIDNLEEVNYAFRPSPSGGELDKTAYTSSIAYYKDDITEYLGTVGLGWEDFQTDWNGSVEKLFATVDDKAYELRERLDLLRSSWTPLAELPAEYGHEQAAVDGVYVNIHGVEIYNQELADTFYRDALAGIPAFMRVMQYTVEGDAIITDYQFDGETYTVTHDNTRDKFAAPDDRIISTPSVSGTMPAEIEDIVTPGIISAAQTASDNEWKNAEGIVSVSDRTDPQKNAEEFLTRYFDSANNGGLLLHEYDSGLFEPTQSIVTAMKWLDWVTLNNYFLDYNIGSDVGYYSSMQDINIANEGDTTIVKGYLKTTAYGTLFEIQMRKNETDNYIITGLDFPDSKEYINFVREFKKSTGELDAQASPYVYEQYNRILKECISEKKMTDEQLAVAVAKWHVKIHTAWGSEYNINNPIVKFSKDTEALEVYDFSGFDTVEAVSPVWMVSFDADARPAYPTYCIDAETFECIGYIPGA